METITNSPEALKSGVAGKVDEMLQKYPIILQLLRFAAIGVINTALDFLVLNFISKTLNISAGLKLGQVNIISFSLAVVQSYFWNRYWAFSAGQVLTLWKNFIRLVLVGALGALAVIFVLIGAKVSASPSFYLIILLAFVIFQLAMWIGFGLSKTVASADNQSKQFIIFLVVSIIGLIINSILLSLISQHFAIVSNADLNKNVAKILATFVSLIWNFIGYKLFVFKK
jgi:putative flippase GtrA